MNRQQLFSRIARRHHVVYSHGLPRASSSVFKLSRGSAHAMDSVLVDSPPSWLVRTGLELVDVQMRHLAAKRWRTLLGCQNTGDLIAYIFHPKFVPYLAALAPRRIVYHAYDLYHRQAAWDASRQRWEKELIDRADGCVASSTAIARRLVSLGRREPLLLENAADFQLFATAAQRGDTPPELRDIPRPRIGYAGALNRKVDFPLVDQLAGRRPDWSFVLLGKFGNLDAVTAPAVSRLRRRRNVHFFAHQPYERVPPWVAAMDVNAMWYRVGPDLWTEGGYPLKLHEYLAAGPPVVGTGLEAVMPYSDVVRVPEGSTESWERAILDALTTDTPTDRDQRQAVARRNDWKSRAEVLESFLLGVSRDGGP